MNDFHYPSFFEHPATVLPHQTNGVGGGSARGEVDRMEISDGEQRPTHGGGEW